MANIWDTVRQALQSKIQSTADRLFTPTASFIKQNPTPIGFLSKQLQPSFQEASTFIRQNPAPTNLAMKLTPQVTGSIGDRLLNTPVSPIPGVTLNTLGNLSKTVGSKLQHVNLPTINIPEPSLVQGGNTFGTAVKSSFPILQAPEQINAFAQSYGRTLEQPQNHPFETVMNVLPMMGLAKTKTVQEALRGRVAVAKTPQEAEAIYREFSDKVIQLGAKDDLQALRATLNKELLSITGGTSGDSFKKDYAVIQTLKDDAQVGGIIRAIEDKISSIDDALAKSPIVHTAKERLANLMNYPEQLSQLGYNPRQIKFIDAKEALHIIDNNISPIDHPSYDKAIASMVTSTKQYVKKAFEANDPKMIQKVQETLDPYNNVKNKVNIIDYLRTPERVLQKIGLGEQAKYLRQQYESYLTQLPEEISKIADWQKRVPSPESNVNIFRFLDGENVQLSPVEQRVADEIRGYLADWATKLKLPTTKRVSDYITHIWEKGAIEGEFDPEIARLIDQKIAKGVYDPFLLKRTNGRIDYLRDTWKALDAYTHRAVRKFNLDPALERLEAGTDKLDVESYKYVQSLTSRINMRPTEVDTLLDNFIKSIPGVGYKLGARPVTALTQKVRQMVYRGALGMNVSSAVRNLTQATNTYAELGEKYTALGYIKMLKNYGTDELEKVGVLRDTLIQDQTVNVYKSLMKKMDQGLFFLFEQAEKINRGSAYYGAKARALAQGKTEQQAIEEAVGIVRKTQFAFGSIDTPVALSSDIVKTFSQFMSYNIKQGEFLLDKVAQKDVVGITRYIVATIILQKLLKDNLGIKTGNEDTNTVVGAIANTLPSPSGYTPPLLQIGQALWNSPKALTGTDAEKRKAQADLLKSGSLLIPGGSQIKKTVEGVQSYNKGESVTPSGNTRFPIEQNFQNYVKSILLGQYSTPDAQRYFDSDARPLSEKQSDLFRMGVQSYEDFMDLRQDNAEDLKARQTTMLTGQPSSNGNKIFYVAPTGSVTSVDVSYIPQKPKMVGDYEIDKEALSKYKSALTTQRNKVYAAVTAGVVDIDQVKAVLSDLTASRAKLTVKKLAKVKMVALKKLSLKKSKKLAKLKKFKLPKLKTIASVKYRKVPNASIPV